MLKAKDISISVHSNSHDNWCTVTFWFDDDGKSCEDAYRAIERLYEMNRSQRGDGWQGPTNCTTL